MIHKKLLNKWICEFITVVCALSDENFVFSVNSGTGVLFMPPDIFSTLKRREVIRGNSGFCFFEFSGDFGETVVEVRADPELNKGLRLSTKEK